MPRTKWYYGWNIVAAAILSQAAAIAITLSCFSLFLHDWSREFAVPISTLAICTTALSIVLTPFAPLAGLAADRFPIRSLVAIALAGLAIGHVGVAFATSAWQIIAIFGTLLPVAMVFSSTVPFQTLVSRWFGRRTGAAMGLSAYGLALPGVILPPIVVVLIHHIGWRNTWLLAAAVIAFVILPFVLLVVREKPNAEECSVEGIVKTGPAHAHTEPGLSYLEILQRRNFWLILGVAVPLQCSYVSVGVNLAPLVASHGFTATIAGALISVMSISALVSKLANGLVADRFGNRPALLGVGLIGAAGLITLALGGDRLPTLFLAIVLMGMSAGFYTLMASAAAADFRGPSFGRAFGLLCAASSLGLAAPYVLARIHEATGSYVTGLFGYAIVVLFCTSLALFYRERRAIVPDPAAPMAGAKPVAH